MFKRFPLFLAGLLSLAPALVHADKAAIDRLNNFVQQVETFQADFVQTVMDESGSVIEEADGEFWLSRPGKFRWDYASPYAQEIVADGTKIWFYDVDLEQISVQQQTAVLTDTPAGLLSGESMPEDAYQIKSISKDDGLQWVEMQPRNIDSNYQRVQLGFDNNGLKEMWMIDAFGQRTRLQFSDISFNEKIDASRFNFTPPEGVDVVGETP